MSDLVQKIAAIYEPLLAKCVDADDCEKLREAIRQALGSAQERGEAVAWGVQKTGEDGVWFVSDSRFTAQHYATAYAHRVGDGKPDQAVIPLYAHPPADAQRVAELEQSCREQRVRAGMGEASLETRTRHLQSCEIALAERDTSIAALEAQLTASREREFDWKSTAIAMLNLPYVQAKALLDKTLAAEKGEKE